LVTNYRQTLIIGIQRTGLWTCLLI